MDTPNSEQATLWNGTAGRAWVETQALLDRMFEPVERLLVGDPAVTAGRSVLDIGCGTGATTLALARRLGPQAHCTGIDISEPMIALARQRAERASLAARFVCDDAQVHPFEPAGFDTLVSRFGVMFFADPVRAFANLRQAAAPGARLCAVVWRSGAENPFMTTAERAAAPLLPEPPPRRPHAPGQFAFADRQRVAEILQDSGWADIDIQPVDIVCTLPEHDLTHYLKWMGPVGQVLQKADEATRARVLRTVRAAFEPFVHGGQVRYTAACWRVGARRPA